MPAVLVEVGFINSDTDNMLFDANFDDIAQAIADGILETLDSLKPTEIPEERGYRVQVGLFRNPNNARRLLEELLEQDFPAYIDDSGPFLAVQVGRFSDLEDAVQLERRLKQAGYETLVVSS